MSKIVTIFGHPYEAQELRSSQKPQPVEITQLPNDHPSASDVYWQRWVIGGLNRKQAAELCGVSNRHYERWEKGISKMPRSTWAWFRVATSGGIASAGKNWNGWSFGKGLLYNPAGTSYSAGDINSISFLHQQIANLKLTIRKLENEPSEKQQQQNEHNEQLQKARGQIDFMGLLIAVLRNEYMNSDNPELQQTADKMFEVMKAAGDVQVDILKACGL